MLRECINAETTDGELARHAAYREGGEFERRQLFCRCCEAPEIYIGGSRKIGEGRPHCDRLVELLRIDLVERVVRSVMGVEIIESILAQ